MICADDARIACPLFQAEYGGEKPTSALQLRLCRVSSDTATNLNRLWHSRLPEIPNAAMGLSWAAEYNNLYYAVLIWSVPSNQNLFNAGCFELRRFAIAPDAPKNTASRLLAVNVRLIRKLKPEIVRLVSYQDTDMHTGTIYRAAGWSLAGRTHEGGKCGWTNNVRVRFESNGQEPLLSVKARWDYWLKLPEIEP